MISKEFKQVLNGKPKEQTEQKPKEQTEQKTEVKNGKGAK